MSEVLVYVGTMTNDPEEGIHRFRLDTGTGALRPAGRTEGVVDPFWVSVNAAGDRLYAAHGVGDMDDRPEGAVSAYAIDPASGDLTFLNRQPCGGKMPCYLSLHPEGGHLLLGNYSSGSVAVLPIADDGRLRPPCDVHQHTGRSVHPQRQEGPHVHAMVLDPTGRWAYAPDLGLDKVMIYGFDAAAGRLRPAAMPWVETVPGAGPRHLAFHPEGAYAYLVNELDNTINAYLFDAGSGALHQIESQSLLPAGYEGESYAADLQILPTGDFLYASNRESNSIAIFRVDSGSGRLTPAGHASPEGAWPWNLALAPGGRLLLAANQRGDCVSVLRVDPATGQLSPVDGSVSVPKPVKVTIAPQVGS